MTTVNLNTLQCHSTTSGPGADDVYIRVDGVKVYGTHEFDDDDSEELNVSREFEEKAKIVVRDYDSTNPDDLIGSFWVHESQAGTGEHAESLTGDGSSYDIYYDVMN
ncbi:hypothetical protein ACFWBH_33815 [Streptomyces sp. NPDC059999]|uniref:hypothetical protein n=1 Tax=Streptomyces sp. NPDC059999 TaxID=3347030 RepID=UPI0036AC0F3C